MANEWIGTVATGAVGAVGIVFAWLSGKQTRDQAKHLEDRKQAQHEADQAKAFYSQILVSARRVQRASKVWTQDQTAENKERFMTVLDDMAVLAAEARLTAPKVVWEKVLDVESAYRRHSESNSATLDTANQKFKLGPLVDVLAQSVPGHSGG